MYNIAKNALFLRTNLQSVEKRNFWAWINMMFNRVSLTRILFKKKSKKNYFSTAQNPPQKNLLRRVGARGNSKILNQLTAVKSLFTRKNFVTSSRVVKKKCKKFTFW